MKEGAFDFGTTHTVLHPLAENYFCFKFRNLFSFFFPWGRNLFMSARKWKWKFAECQIPRPENCIQKSCSNGHALMSCCLLSLYTLYQNANRIPQASFNIPTASCSESITFCKILKKESENVYLTVSNHWEFHFFWQWNLFF